MMQHDNVLDIRDLVKVYKSGGIIFGKKFKAVDNVSMTLSNSPEIFTIVGESGCGKTTLARMVLGLIEPTSGSIRILGRDIWKLSAGERYRWLPKHVQPVFQNPFESFNPLRKVSTYLIHTAKKVAGVEDDGEAAEIVSKALEEVRLSPEVADRTAFELSGGQVQRLSIARALISRPRLIVADEPVSMIDASLRMGILNIFKRLKEERGISFVYITHDLATAYYISDRIAVMYKGSFVEAGEADAIFREPLHPYTQLLMESIPRIDKKWVGKAPVYTTDIEAYLAAGCKFADRCPFAMEKCRRESPPLIRLSNGVSVACWLYEKPSD
ncbi:MAG: ABC transporter ATP-binding protein [Candidatus Caldarchaeales archaeon]|jgi:peptide/nickel transport system ATP-binding protein|nr:ABC transporter ATP-binding protein [Candidatus Caldarchaeales archaeon]